MKLTRLYIWLFAIFSLLGGTSVSAGQADDYLQAGVTIAASSSWRPYSFISEDGQVSGFLIDYWKKWSNVTGVPVEFKLVPWAETLKLVASGEYDIHSGLYRTAERVKLFDFSLPIDRSQGALVVAKEEVDCGTAYEEATIGVVAGSFEESTLISQHPETKLVSFIGTDKMLDAFMQGNIHGVVMDVPTIVALDSNEKFARAYKICETVYERELLSGVRKGNEELLSIVNTGIQLISDGEFKSLRRRWFVEKPADSVIMKASVAAASLLVFISLLVFGWVTHRSRS